MPAWIVTTGREKESFSGIRAWSERPTVGNCFILVALANAGRVYVGGPSGGHEGSTVVIV